MKDKIEQSGNGRAAGQGFLHSRWARLLAVFLALALLAGSGLLVFRALKPNACGLRLTWRYDGSSSRIIIEGRGKMYDYKLSGYGKAAPWHDAGEMIFTAVLPEGLTSIGDYAFCGCCGMQEVTIPESVRSIGEGAFRACSLRTLTIPKNVTAIGKDAFYAGGVLESFSVHPENACFSSDEAGALYDREQTVLIDVPTGKRGTFAIPDSVKTIGDGAFEHCYELSAVTIPEGLTSIGCYAFTDCIGLTSVTIPDGVTSIGEAAFIYCCQLRAVTIPASVTEIGDNAFQYCEELTIRGVPGSEAERYAKENGIPFEATP